MKVLVIADPIAGWHAYKDSTLVLMLQAQQRGAALAFTTPDTLHVPPAGAKTSPSSAGVMPWVRAHPVTVRDVPEGDWYTLGETRDVPLSAFDVVLMRQDPPFDLEYLYATHLLELAAAQGVRVLNAPRGVRNLPEKLAILRFPELTAPTLVSRDVTRLRDFCLAQADAIVKPLDGMGGRGVFRVQSAAGRPDPNLNVVLETLTANGTTTVMAQRYLPRIAQGDLRVLVIHGKPFPYGLARMAQGGETRANLAAGGIGVARAIGPDAERIAERVAPLLIEQGIALAGLDVIGDRLSEINVTSPTCLREIWSQTGHNPAQAFWDGLVTTGQPGLGGAR